MEQVTTRAPPFLLLSVAVHAAVALALVRASQPAPAPIALAGEHPDLVGETFELPAPETFVPGGAAGEPASAPKDEGEVTEDDVRNAPSKAPARPTPPRRAAPSAPAGAGEVGAAPAQFGALDDRSATDLASAFTRGFPQAASADPVWRTAPLGSTGRAIVVLELSDDGRIVSSRVEGSGSSELAAGIRRTLALLGTRPLKAHGRVTRLAVSGRVYADEVHDGLHGDVFAVGASFTGWNGVAFFALAIGRRIEVQVNELASSAR